MNIMEEISSPANNKLSAVPKKEMEISQSTAQREGGSEEDESIDAKHIALDQMSNRSTNFQSMSIGSAELTSTPIKAANRQYRVRPEVTRFPLCITWTPLPALT